MKKQLLLVALIFSATIASAQNLRTDRDSLAYAYGVVIANGAMDIDSTLDKDLVIKGFTDNLKDRASIPYDEAYAIGMKAFYPEYTEADDSENFSEGDEIDYEQAEFEYLESLDARGDVKITDSGLRYIIENKGGKKQAKEGEEISFFFDLYDIDGDLIQSARAEGSEEPMVVINQDGEIIDGLIEGLRMLGKGGKARFFVPSALAYGSESFGGLNHPYSTIVFDVEVVKIAKAKKNK